MIFHDDLSDLANLVGLGFIAYTLQVNEFFNPLLAEHMMAASYMPIKTHALQQLAQIIEGNVLITAPSQNL